MSKIISVVIPCYNVEKYIEECLNSICRQTYSDLEIICVDDGSTDSTVKIIENYQRNDQRITLLRQENQYAGVARNNGMDIAIGEYIIFLDGDDFFDTKMIDKMLRSAIQCDSDIVLCDGYFYDDKTKEITEPSYLLNSHILKKQGGVFSCRVASEKIFQITNPAPWNKLYKREFIDREGLRFQELKRANDDYFVSMSLVLAERISYVEERLVNYRVNNCNSLQGYSDKDVSFHFYMSLKAIREELICRKLWYSVKETFVNKAVSACITALNRQNNCEHFVEVYEFLKTEAFEELEIYKHEKDIAYSWRDTFEKIKKLNATEFLFNKLVEQKEASKVVYKFPFQKLDKAKNIALYGAGTIGKSYHQQICANKYYNLCGWYDEKYEELRKQTYIVDSPEEIDPTIFEKIVIAIGNEKIKRQVVEYIEKKGVASSDII